MIDNSWAYETESKVFSKLKAKVLAKLKTSYPRLNITMDGKIHEDADFPSVWFQTISYIERGQDLESQSINAVQLSVQIDIVVTEAQGMVVAREVSSIVTEAMKSMYFNVTMPTLDFSGDEVRTVSRFDRIIGQGDIY